MELLTEVLAKIDEFVWGPVMLILLVGTGVFLTIRTKFLCWRNLPYALKSVLSKEARKKKGRGDVSPFSALTTALAATIGTGNIVGVATAMVSGGPGALVWMWISACFGLTSKFTECMLAIKYREVNEKGEMSGGPMYTMKNGFKHKKVGIVFGICFALFAVIASFGIGNLTQANSISTAMQSTFHIPTYITGIVITVLTLVVVIGGIHSISKVSQIVVPAMAIIYIVAGLGIIVGNIANLPAGVAMIFQMAFSVKAVGGGLCGALVASMMHAMRFGIARGTFSNEAGMGSAAITAAAATTDDPVKQGYINMTGTFWDTIVVCTITGLAIASSGVLGTTQTVKTGSFELKNDKEIRLELKTDDAMERTLYAYEITDLEESAGKQLTLTSKMDESQLVLTSEDAEGAIFGETWLDENKNEYVFGEHGKLKYNEIVEGSALTISAFKTVLGEPGGWFVCIAIAFFAFSTILGWEYHGEKALEFLLGTHRYNMAYRFIFSGIVFLGATTTLEIAWSFSDIANALMSVPNLICMIVLSSVVVEEMTRYQSVIKEKKAAKKAAKKAK